MELEDIFERPTSIGNARVAGEQLEILIRELLE